MFQKPGFVAATTTSTGFAWTTGRADYAVTREEVMQHVAGLYDSKLAAERVQAARASIEASGEDDVILVARTERLLSSPDAITQAIDSLVIFAEAGADCLYAPGVQKKEDIAAMVRAVAP